MSLLTGLVQDIDKQIQGALMDYSRTKIKIFKELSINIHSACVNTQEAQKTENDIILGVSAVFLHDFLQAFFWIIFKIIFRVSIAVKEVNSTHSQISRGWINFQGVPSSVEMTFEIQAHFKESKDLHEPCT